MKPQTILVVEDNPITRKMVRVTLESEGYAALEAPDGRTALELMKKHAPQLILQDLLLPDIDGLDLLRRLRALPRGREIPILAFSGFLSKMDEARTLQVGFTGFLFKPVEPSVLLGAVRNYLAPAGPSADQPGRGRRVLLVDDDPLQRKLQELHLKHLGFEVVAAEDGKKALEQARSDPPDIILSDVFLPGLDGFQLCLAVRRDPHLAHVPVVLTSCVFVEEEDRRLGQNIGANAFVTRSPDLSALKEVILKSLNEAAPRPRARARILMEEHVLRTTRALERQVTMNSGLARRCSVLSAELSLLTVLSDTLAGSWELDHVLGQVLSCLLDAGAFSSGAAYLVEKDGSLSLRAHLGYLGSSGTLLGSFFGNTALLRRALDDGETLAVPSPKVPGDEAADLLAKAGAKSLLIAPLVLGREPLGALVMALAHRELEDWVAFSKTIAVHLSQALGLARALERLASSERRYRDLVDGLDAIVWEADAVTRRFSFVSHRAREILGYPLERWMADAGFWTQHIHPEDRERVAAELQTAITARRSCDLEYRALAADGRVVWLRNMVRVVEACPGCPQQFRGVMVDITAKKLSEEALRETNETLQSLVQACPLPIIALDREEKIHLWNRAAKQVFGWSEQEVLGKPYPLVPDEGRAEYRAILDRILGGEQITNLETSRQKKDGARLRVKLSAAPIRDARGEICSLMAVLDDVTEEKLLEEQFRQTQRLEGIGRLAGGVAHDFNNLVNVISGYSVLLLERLPEADPLRKYANEIRKAGDRAAALTRQLLAFSRKQVLEPRVLDLNAVVAEMARLLERLIGEDVELITVLAPDLGRVKTDPGQIEQVIMNIAVNARDAMPQGGKLIIQTENVELDQAYANQHVSAAPGPHVMLAVSDTGCGMDAKVRAHIFEPFFTTKEKGKGTGLGLATVYGIVKQSGGHIWVYSELQRGTTIKVYLPRVEEAAPATRAEKAWTPSRRGWETVLLVEDEESLRRLAREFLENNGYTVLEAGNGEEAVSTCEKHQGPIHLMVTDVVMPGMSGRELATLITVSRPNMKLLYVSGYTDEAISHHGVLDPGVAFLQKPFTADDLARKVCEVLAG